MTADWENFVASLDPAAVEAERMRVHGDLNDERPGSRADHEMRRAHDYLAHLASVEARTTREQAIARIQEADADREIARRGFTSTDIEAAIRSYSQQHNERHAA